ncbi:MAG: hypothetical protein H0U49_01940 [Parachlamydiaceae bacterium]|nr:hypothetical protein [Parachlamydiaceae bacterium]
MFKVSHANVSFISGLIWICVGCFLLQMGLKLILDPTYAPGGSTPILSNIQGVMGGLQEAGIALIAIALYIGYLKGKHLLRKSARQGVERLRSFPDPMPIQNMYSPKYYILLGGMIGLGMSMRFLGLPNDIRGGIDVAVGAALINGALEYFRLGLALRKKRVDAS